MIAANDNDEGMDITPPVSPVDPEDWLAFALAAVKRSAREIQAAHD